MIFIEPLLDGSIRLNAYGLYAGEVMDALRRALIHLHAQRSGVQVISVEVPAAAAVVASKATSVKAAKAKAPSTNGRRAMRSELADPAVPRYSLADLGLDEDEE